MKQLLEYFKIAFPQYAQKITEIGTEGVVREALTIPLRILLFSILYRASSSCKTNATLKIPSLQILPIDRGVLVIALIYLVDLQIYILDVGILRQFSRLQPLSLLLFNEYPSTSQCLIFFVCLDVLFIASIGIKKLRPYSLVGFILTEALVYSFGYTENTFSTFKLMLAWVCLILPLKKPQSLLNLIMLVYMLSGFEKLLVGWPLKTISTSGLDLYGIVSNYEVTTVVAFQLAPIFIYEAPILARLTWVGLAICFHILVAERLSIGGISSPWIVTLIVTGWHEYMKRDIKS